MPIYDYADFNVPMQDNLLWVYEGQTQFWGYVLGARSGMFTKEQTLDAYAQIAARLDTAVGRQWRPLEDTTHDPIISARRPKGWLNWQRVVLSPPQRLSLRRPQPPLRTRPRGPLLTWMPPSM